MALEIKGLGDGLRRARAAIAQARSSTSSLEETVRAFVADVNSVEAQVKQQHDDLIFEASTLGNSSNSGERLDSQEEKTREPTTIVVSPAKPDPPSVPAKPQANGSGNGEGERQFPSYKDGVPIAHGKPVAGYHDQMGTIRDAS